MYALYPDGFTLFLMYGINTLLTALMLVCSWFLYIKMGVPGWKGLVPFYNVWTAVKVLKKPRYWFWVMVASTAIMLGSYILFLGGLVLAASAGAPPVGSLEPGVMLGPLFLGSMIALGLSMLVLIVFSIRLTYALCKSFGHGVGYTIGLIFLPFVFYPILAFGPDEFIQPREPNAKNADQPIPGQTPGAPENTATGEAGAVGEITEKPAAEAVEEPEKENS